VAKKTQRQSPAAKTTRQSKPPRGEPKVPTLPPKPLQPGVGTDWVSVGGRHAWWPRPRKWS
jgi:hypothetical protein